MIFDQSRNHADVTEEARERTRLRLWQRRNVTDEDEGLLARAIAKTHGSNPGLFAEPMERAYKAAEINVTNQHWVGSRGSADAVTRNVLPIIRDRARDAEESNPYAERYLAELGVNVLGPDGMALQMQIMNWDPEAETLLQTGKKKKGAWQLDEQANDIVETAWLKWKAQGICDVSGELSYLDCENLALRSTARDGDCLIRMVRDWNGNEFGFALQLIEGDALDHNYNTALPNGNVVVMGVEFDQWKKRVAYHILTRHPGDYFIPAGNPINGDRRERVDARDIIHLRFMRRIGQTRGVSWMAPVLDSLEMLRGYEEAELVSARAEACKGGFFYSDLVPEGGFVGAMPDPIKSVRTMKMSPAQMRSLPYGVKYQEVNPTHPNGNYTNYRSGVLRGIASGLLVSYNILANDLVGVNYSSLRGGLLDEREIYKSIQAWFIQRFELIVFQNWLESAIVYQQIKGFTLERLQKYNAPFFQGRRWDWVDPLKDIEAIEKAVANGLTSIRAENLKRGQYVADIAREQEQDKRLAEQHGLQWQAMLPEAAADVPTVEDPTAGAGQAEVVQDTALNGAQVTALLEIVQAYATGQIPKETAAAVIQAAFPSFEPERVALMLDKITVKEPEKPAQQNAPNEKPAVPEVP